MDLNQVLEVTTAILGVAFIFAVVRFWRNEGRHIVKESGYAAPTTRLWARMLAQFVAWLIAPFTIGRVTVRGGANARAQEKRWRYVVVINHQIPQDSIVAGRLAKLRRWRFMVAMEEVRRPFLGPLYALVGAIPVIRPNSEAAKGELSPMRAAAAAVMGAVNALKSDKEAGLRQKGLYPTLGFLVLGALTALLHIWWLAAPLVVLGLLCMIDLFVKRPTHFVIFPQGHLVENDELKPEDFHTGPVKIARRLAKETGEQVAMLPVHFRYERNSGNAGFLTRKLVRPFFGYGPVYGVTVTIGEPLPIEQLPAKDDEAAHRIFDEIQALKSKSIGAQLLRPTDRPAASAGA